LHTNASGMFEPEPVPVLAAGTLLEQPAARSNSTQAEPEEQKAKRMSEFERARERRAQKRARTELLRQMDPRKFLTARRGRASISRVALKMRFQ
jgi:hypothetical protein